MPVAPPLKDITADETPNSNVLRPTKTSLGHHFQIIPLIISFFCIFPCKHLLNNLPTLRSIKMGLIFSQTALKLLYYSIF